MNPSGNSILSLFEYVLAGGSNAIVALLLVIILIAIFAIRYLMNELKRSRSELSNANDRYLKLLETYHDSNSTVTAALNGVKMVLIEIKAKL